MEVNELSSSGDFFYKHVHKCKKVYTVEAHLEPYSLKQNK
jgi:hypothetical protein